MLSFTKPDFLLKNTYYRVDSPQDDGEVPQENLEKQSTKLMSGLNL